MTNIGMTIRSFRPDDLPALVQLINEADRVDDAGNSTTLAALSHRLSEPRIKPTENLFVAEVDGRLVGYVLLLPRQEATLLRMGVAGIVHPQWRRQGIGTALMRHAEERAGTVRSDKPVFLDLVTRERIAGMTELAMSLGLHPVRYFFYMQCHDLSSLPDPALPAGITLRNLNPQQDAEAFLVAYNDGFSDHWGYVPTTREQLQHWFDSPRFCAEDALLAVTQQGDIAGVCIVLFPQMDAEMLKSNPPHIDDLAVPHAYRRRGIGRALLLAGMHRIRRQGFQACALGVDADNPNKALHLYESVGFAVASRSTAFRKELAATAERKR